MRQPFDGTIVWAQSLSTGRKFPILVFSGDVDYATSGWHSFTIIAQLEVVAVHSSSHFGPLLLQHESEREAAVNSELNRSDLRTTELRRVEEQGRPPSGLSFQDFKQQYKEPSCFYRDILDMSTTAEAKEVRRQSLIDFTSQGGIITTPVEIGIQPDG